MSANVLASAQNPPKIILHVQKGYTGSKCAIVMIMVTAIFSCKMHFQVNCHVEALDAVEVKT